MDTASSTPNDDNSAATTTQAADALGSGGAAEASASVHPDSAGTQDIGTTTAANEQNSPAANDNSPTEPLARTGTDATSSGQLSRGASPRPSISVSRSSSTLHALPCPKFVRQPSTIRDLTSQNSHASEAKLVAARISGMTQEPSALIPIGITLLLRATSLARSFQLLLPGPTWGHFLCGLHSRPLRRMFKHRSHHSSGDGCFALSMLFSQLSAARRSPLKRTKEFVRLSWAAAHLGLGRWDIASGIWPTDAASDFVRQHPSKRKAVDELHQQVLAECARIEKGMVTHRIGARRKNQELARG
jgi:hypothetical protein